MQFIPNKPKNNWNVLGIFAFGLVLFTLDAILGKDLTFLLLIGVCTYMVFAPEKAEKVMSWVVGREIKNEQYIRAAHKLAMSAVHLFTGPFARNRKR